MWMRYWASFKSSKIMDNQLVLQPIQVETLVLLGNIFRGKTSNIH